MVGLCGKLAGGSTCAAKQSLEHSSASTHLNQATAFIINMWMYPTTSRMKSSSEPIVMLLTAVGPVVWYKSGENQGKDEEFLAKGE